MHFINQKPLAEHNLNDLYQTPKCLTFELLKTGQLENIKTVLEPCCGKKAISSILKSEGFIVEERDLLYGNNFLKDEVEGKYDAIITNPPFSMYDDFVLKAKEYDVEKIIMIGRVNLFGSHSRTVKKIWENLSDVYVFDRQIVFSDNVENPKAGCLVCGWFIWTKNYTDDPKLHFIDIDKYIFRKGNKNEFNTKNITIYS